MSLMWVRLNNGDQDAVIEIPIEETTNINRLKDTISSRSVFSASLAGIPYYNLKIRFQDMYFKADEIVSVIARKTGAGVKLDTALVVDLPYTTSPVAVASMGAEFVGEGVKSDISAEGTLSFTHKRGFEEYEATQSGTRVRTITIEVASKSIVRATPALEEAKASGVPALFLGEAPPLAASVADPLDESGEFIQIYGLPSEVCSRYSINSYCRIYRRKCYNSLYEYLKNIVRHEPQSPPVIHFNGVPGIGKSFFMIFIMIMLLYEDDSPVKEYFVEYYRGVYMKIALNGKENIPATDSNSNWAAKLHLVVTVGDSVVPDVFRDLLLCDLKDMNEPMLTARWTCIFSSPNPARYKQTMNAQTNYTFCMPTWSEIELQLTHGGDVGRWYERFEVFGGVPRHVLWNEEGNNPLKNLELAIQGKARAVIDHFFTSGFGNIDPEKSYMLVHINPPWDAATNDWRYLDAVVHSFASDYIFKLLQKRYETYLVSVANNFFTAGVGSYVFGGGTAGNIFEKILLWLKPMNKQKITMLPLEDGHSPLTVMLPEVMELLPRYWKATGRVKNDQPLKVGVLYQPRISNLESGDSFCIIRQGTSLILIVLQMTVSECHGIKANGLREIILAYSPDVQSQISSKVLCFVTSKDGALRTLQPLHTQQGKVIEPNKIPKEARGFVQYLCQYTI